MSRQRQENSTRAEKLLKIFDATHYPAEYPWVMEFLCKVKINGGRVNTTNQQDTLSVLWGKYGC